MRTRSDAVRITQPSGTGTLDQVASSRGLRPTRAEAYRPSDQTVSGVSPRNACISHVEHREGHAMVRRNHRGDSVPGGSREVKHSLRAKAARSGPPARGQVLERATGTCAPSGKALFFV